jgi:hypothetical protein
MGMIAIVVSTILSLLQRLASHQEEGEEGGEREREEEAQRKHLWNFSHAPGKAKEEEII